MQLTSRSLPITPALHPTQDQPSRALYFALAREVDAQSRDSAAEYLRAQLEAAAALPSDLQEDPAGMEDRGMRRTEVGGRQYQAYLDQRRAGGLGRTSGWGRWRT